jgi:hypothetical protein
MASPIHFVAAELGVSLVTASMRSLKMPDVVDRELSCRPTLLHLALASRRGDTSPVLGNFIARATACGRPPQTHPGGRFVRRDAEGNFVGSTVEGWLEPSFVARIMAAH